MNLGIEQLVSWGGSAIGLVGMWFRLENRVDRLSDKDAHQQDQINGIGKSLDEHIKDHMAFFIKNSEDMTAIKVAEASSMVVKQEILARLSKIESVLEELRSRK